MKKTNNKNDCRDARPITPQEAIEANKKRLQGRINKQIETACAILSKFNGEPMNVPGDTFGDVEIRKIVLAKFHAAGWAIKQEADRNESYYTVTMADAVQSIER